ncbi:MAG TPA: FecR domain-containing protein [Planctomycetota bacterium]|nr:FecR domain-containing protein [Planctomycetota bacterium]
MSPDWRELLDRALEGDELSAPEAEALAAALASDEQRPEALALVCFEGQLRQRLAPEAGPVVALSRERLLAKAALREKASSVRAGRRRGRRVAAALAAAAALLVAALAGLVLRAERGYPAPRASGDFRILGPASPAVERGQSLAAGAGGAELRLGGYCRVTLDPNTQVTLRGERRREAIVLTRGRVVCEVEPGRGEFALVTPIGSVEVKGTKFLTSVEYPESQKGESDMGKLRKAAVVTVMVVTGVVACHFGDVAVLGPGMSQVFAGGDRERATLPPELKGFKGILVGTIASEVTREFLLKIDKVATTWPQSKAEAPERAVGKTIEMVVGQNRMLEQHLQTLRTLRKGDQIIVEAFDVQGFRLTIMELLRKAEESGERREGEGEVREKRPHGEGEVREKPAPREGEGEWREKKTEPRTGGLRELEGWVKATPDQGVGVMKVVERIRGEEGVQEKVSQYRIRPDDVGRRLVAEANGRRAAVAGVLVEGDLGVVLAVKKFRVLGSPDEPRRDKPERREGEGEVREKKPERRDGEGEWREKPVRRDGEGEGEWRERKPEGDAPKPRVEAGGPATAEMLAGFRGMLEGTVVGKADDAFVLRVEKVTKVWQSSTCKTPEALVGKILSLTLKYEANPPEALVKALAALKAGERVLAGAIHREGKVVSLVEVLRKIDAE